MPEQIEWWKALLGVRWKTSREGPQPLPPQTRHQAQCAVNQIRKAEEMSLSKKLEYTMAGIPIEDLALGYLRYEALRKLDYKQIYVLWIKADDCVNLDTLVDELIEKDGSPDIIERTADNWKQQKARMNPGPK